MKVTNPEVIRQGEADLMASIKESLDPSVLEGLALERFAVADLSLSGGEMVVHQGEVAYRLDLTVTVDVRIHMDREGCLLTDHPAPPSEGPEKVRFEPSPAPPGHAPPGEITYSGPDSSPREGEPSSPDHSRSRILAENREFWAGQRRRAEKMLAAGS